MANLSEKEEEDYQMQLAGHRLQYDLYEFASAKCGTNIVGQGGGYDLFGDILREELVVDHAGVFETPNVSFGVFLYDIDNNIVGISGRTLKVLNLSKQNNNEPYFQAFVSGYQNDGKTHNEAVKNALDFAEKNKRSN